MNPATESRVLRLFAELREEKIDLHAFRELVAGNDRRAKAEIVSVLERMVQQGFLEEENDFYWLTEKGRRAAAAG